MRLDLPALHICYELYLYPPTLCHQAVSCRLGPSRTSISPYRHELIHVPIGHMCLRKTGSIDIQHQRADGESRKERTKRKRKRHNACHDI